MPELLIPVETEEEQVREFCRFAEQYSSDFDLPQLRRFRTMDLEEVHQFVVSNYRLEQEEQILRPKFYLNIPSDCDDGTIFLIALFLNVGMPKQDIFICEAKQESQDEYYCHIFCAVRGERGQMIYLDNLPGSRFGKNPYPTSRFKITPLNFYI